MLTLTYDCISNFCILLFAILLFKNNRFAWIAIIISLMIKFYTYSQYSMLFSSVYLSVDIISAIVATIIWIKNPKYTKIKKTNLILALLTGFIAILVWLGLIYKFVNPEVIKLKTLFSFDYLCYILFTLGIVLLAYRIILGLVFLAVYCVSFALNYAYAGWVASKASQYVQNFSIYYWISAVMLFVAGIVLINIYTRFNKS